MNHAMTPAPCPSCGSALSPGAAQGLCPRCLLAGVAAPTEPTLPRPAPPSLAEVAAAIKKNAAAHPQIIMTSSRKNDGIAELRASIASLLNDRSALPEWATAE